MLERTLCLMGVVVCLEGCATVPPSTVYAGGKSGQELCAALEAGARDMSSVNASLAWVLAGSSLGAVTAGGIVTGVNAERKEADLAIVGLALIAGGALLAPAAQALFTRSDAANILAEAANLGLLKREDRDAHDHCTTATGQWVRSRGDANNFAVVMLNDQVAKEEERKKAEEEAQKKIDQAVRDKLVIEATAKAEAEQKAKAEQAEKEKAAKVAKDQAELEATRKAVEAEQRRKNQPVVKPVGGGR